MNEAYSTLNGNLDDLGRTVSGNPKSDGVKVSDRLKPGSGPRFYG